MTERFCFLDIDGPVIPTQCYYIDRQASFQRIFSNVAVHTVKRLLNVCDAKLVCNSTHNYLMNAATNTDLKTDLIAAGIPENKFADDWRTRFRIHLHKEQYGWIPLKEDYNDNRLKAIDDWFARNLPEGAEYEWICFDDDPFTTLPNLILIDFDRGVDLDAYKRALKQFGIKDKGGIVLH